MSGQALSKVGETLEASLWFNAEKEGEEQSAKDGIYSVFLVIEDHQGLEMGPVSFTVMEHGDPRVPPPPPEFGGTPKLMVGEAVIVKVRTFDIGVEVGFTQDLEEDDLAKLRKITQGAYLLSKPPGTKPLTDEQLDTIINEVGPETARKTLETGVNQWRPN